MKMLKLASLCSAVVLYATVALAQHGNGNGTPGGGMGGGMGMGAGADHGSMGTSSHGPSDRTTGNSTVSTQKANINGILGKNPAIGNKIQTLTGMPANQACAGFKNLGQCVAAAHVSKNLGVSFGCLKDDMTGTAPTDPKSCPAGTGTNGKMSLGRSIQALDPKADQKSESKKAETEAQQDMSSTKS